MKQFFYLCSQDCKKSCFTTSQRLHRKKTAHRTELFFQLQFFKKLFLKSQKKFVGFRPKNIFDEFYPDPKTFSLQGLEYGTQATVAKKCGSRPETDCHSKTLTIFPSYTTTPLIISNKGKRTTMNRFCAQVRAIHSCRPQLVICFSLSLSLSFSYSQNFQFKIDCFFRILT